MYCVDGVEMEKLGNLRKGEWNFRKIEDEIKFVFGSGARRELTWR